MEVVNGHGHFFDYAWVRNKFFTICFAAFLVVIFFYSLFGELNQDWILYRDSGLHVDWVGGSHAVPILPVIFYNLVSQDLLKILSALAIVMIYVELYLLVSKKIIYLWPISFLLPLYFPTLLPLVIDWLILPIVYYYFNKDRNKEAIILGVLMVLFHGPYALIYLIVVAIMFNKFREFALIFILSLPQLIPLWYFSRGYVQFIIEADYIWTVFGKYTFVLSAFEFRVIIMGVYILMFVILHIDRKKLTHTNNGPVL